MKAHNLHPASPAWLRDAVFYQIYPQSFCDTNGDGIGDLNGVIERLDYLVDLGVDAFWLNPCFESPFFDAGYDVSDYYRVAPRYGTNADMQRLFLEAGRRNLRVLLDLVAGHTSNQHPWFQAAADDPHGPAADRYIWKKREVGGRPTTEHYVKNFFDCQPALNFGYAHPTEPWQQPPDAPGPLANREELKKIIGFWMDQGASGFRVDMAASLVKEDGESGYVETAALWNEVRSWFEARYPEGILVAEWGDPAVAVRCGFHMDFMMHFGAPGYPELFFGPEGTFPGKAPCYFDAEGRGSARLFTATYVHQRAAVGGRGYVSVPSANHDFQRLCCGTRTGDALRPAWVFLLTQAGPPVIYYGDEIGMRYVPDMPAKEGSLIGDVHERAGSRTPMQWAPGERAGFSRAAPRDFYLPLDPSPERPNVEDQQKDPDSLWHFIKALIRLRKATPALGAEGLYRPLSSSPNDYPLVYLRGWGAQRCVVAVNPSARIVEARHDVGRSGARSLLCRGAACTFKETSLCLRLEPMGYAIWELTP